MNSYNTFRSRILGLSLVELMIAIAISSFLLLGLTTMFRNSSEAQRALEKSSQLIENGRYAINVIYEDLRHVGYFGHFYTLGNALTVLPDPCAKTISSLTNAMNMPLQVYTAANMSSDPVISSSPSTTCTSLLPDDNLEEGSDILILRRADTAVFTGNPNTNEVYIQANAQTANLMMGNSSADVPTDSADDGTTANLLKYPSKTGNTTIADTRKYHVHLYFIAPCSRGSGANDICVDGVDDEIPTLKRLELTQDGGTTVMDIVPLVEGIEFMKFEYGIDDNPSTVNDVTGLQGDGVPDTYVTSPSVAQMSQIVSVKVHLLARSPDETTGFADAKQYTLAGNVIAAPGDAYKRHVFSSEIRLMNLGGRREIPE